MVEVVLKLHAGIFIAQNISAEGEARQLPLHHLLHAMFMGEACLAHD